MKRVERESPGIFQSSRFGTASPSPQVKVFDPRKADIRPRSRDAPLDVSRLLGAGYHGRKNRFFR